MTRTKRIRAPGTIGTDRLNPRQISVEKGRVAWISGSMVNISMTLADFNGVIYR
jgi:hypothetical protein